MVSAIGIGIMAQVVILKLWIVDIQGRDTVNVLRGNEVYKLRILDEVREGDIIEVAGFTVSLLGSKSIWNIGGEGKVKISEEKPVALSGDVKVEAVKMSDEKLKIVEDRILLNSSGVRLKAISGDLLYPVNMIIDRENVIFRWKESVLGKLEIMDSRGNNVKTVGVNGKWTSVQLERGKRYCWRVITNEGRNLGEACFYIATEKEVQEVNKKGEELMKDDRKYGALLWAIYLEENGFYEKAIDILQKLNDERLKFKIEELKQKLGLL